jgi:hypothetical protein
MQVIKLLFALSNIHMDTLVVFFHILYEGCYSPDFSLFLLTSCTQYLRSLCLDKFEKGIAAAISSCSPPPPSHCQNHHRKSPSVIRYKILFRTLINRLQTDICRSVGWGGIKCKLPTFHVRTWGKWNSRLGLRSLITRLCVEIACFADSPLSRFLWCSCRDSTLHICSLLSSSWYPSKERSVMGRDQWRN